MTQQDKHAIRPFGVNFPEEETIELKRRINAIRWRENEIVTDQSQAARNDSRTCSLLG
jgi:hypothetical protein